MDNTIYISMTFDNNYLPYAYVTLFSVFKNNSDSRVEVYIIHKDLTEESKDCLNALAEKFNDCINYLYIDEKRVKDILPTIGRWRAEAYFRLFIPELIPNHIEKILYLDSDMIITASLLELFKTPIDDYDLAGCYDLNIESTSADVFLSNRHPNLQDLFVNRSYINSGVLLLNLNRLRSVTIQTYLDSVAELEYKILAPDQDLINYVHRNHILLLDPRAYNYPAYIAFLEGKSSENLAKESVIVHFVGEKPWAGGDHAHFPTESLWWDYAMETSYKDFFEREYIYNSLSDLTLFKHMQGIDGIRDELYNENIRLKKELMNATEQMRKIVSMFENK